MPRIPTPLLLVIGLLAWGGTVRYVILLMRLWQVVEATRGQWGGITITWSDLIGFVGSIVVAIGCTIVVARSALDRRLERLDRRPGRRSGIRPRTRSAQK